jgi:hypothetical protein
MQQVTKICVFHLLFDLRRTSTRPGWGRGSPSSGPLPRPPTIPGNLIRILYKSHAGIRIIMSHCTLQFSTYVKPRAKIWTPGSAVMLPTARTPLTAGKPITAGPPARASSKGTSEMLATPGTPAIAGRPATAIHQELKGSQQQQECLPQFGCKQSRDARNNSNSIAPADHPSVNDIHAPLCKINGMT